MNQRKAPNIQMTGLRSGDVLLCCSAGGNNAIFSWIGKKIRKATKSDYTHAAICVDSNNAAESTMGCGVNVMAINELVGRYDHIAVFRQPDAWSDIRVKALQWYIDRIIKSGAKYNLEGLFGFVERQKLHSMTVLDQLRLYFEGDLEPAPILKERYFCSELVADCFVATGFIQPSAAVVYHSSTISPGALGRDPTFGTFVGYIKGKPDYEVPTSDEYYRAPTFDEIWK